LCFADNLIIFSATSSDSIKVIKGVLDEFEDLAGLRANPSKSSLFFGVVSSGSRKEILDLTQMQEGKLPIRYLGVPLISKRLSAANCDSLVSKIVGRIDSWLVKNLSFVGSLQLVSSVLLSLQVYWAKVLILPKRVMFLIQQKCN
jgi:hypothetical protein